MKRFLIRLLIIMTGFLGFGLYWSESFSKPIEWLILIITNIIMILLIDWFANSTNSEEKKDE